MKFTYLRVCSILFVLTILLSGCLFPDSELEQNQKPNKDQLELVQSMVDEYQDETDGLVPIKTNEAETPEFQKYLVDFTALKEKGLITETPGNAYENGGTYQYVILTPDEDPHVKLIDLQMTEDIRKVQVKLDTYRNEHTYPPFGEEIAPDIYEINYKKLGFDRKPVVTSPYSQKKLPIILDAEGELYVDYRMDLYEALHDHEHDYKNGDDIRYLLTDTSPFAPAYSLPYTVKDGEPVFNAR